MENYINKPLAYDWTEEEIYSEYTRSGDKRSIRRQFCLTAKEINRIIKRFENNEKHD